MKTTGYRCTTVPFGEHELHISVSPMTRGSFTRSELIEACDQVTGRLKNEFRNSGILNKLSGYKTLNDEVMLGSAQTVLAFNGKQLLVEIELSTQRDCPTPWELLRSMVPTFRPKPALALAA